MANKMIGWSEWSRPTPAYREVMCDNWQCIGRKLKHEETVEEIDICDIRDENYNDPFKYLPLKDTHSITTNDDLFFICEGKLPCSTPARSPSPMRHAEPNQLFHAKTYFGKIRPECPAHDPKINKTLRYEFIKLISKLLGWNKF